MALESLTQKQRTAVVVGALVFLAIALFLAYSLSTRALDRIEGERAAALDALRTIRNERPNIKKRAEKRALTAGRFNTKAPALAGFVEGASREANVTLAQTRDIPPVTLEGKKFQRRAVQVQLHRIDLQSLLTFMSKIEEAQFPVAITSMRIRHRSGEANSFDVDDMVISTWDRLDNSSARTVPLRPIAPNGDAGAVPVGTVVVPGVAIGPGTTPPAPPVNVQPSVPPPANVEPTPPVNAGAGVAPGTLPTAAQPPGGAPTAIPTGIVVPGIAVPMMPNRAAIQRDVK